VELDDRIAISTPEGVEIELQLAGAGSRFIAGVIDMALQGVLLALAAVALGALLGLSGGAGVAIFTVVLFATYWGYDVLFEVLASGRTPGKRLTHLRVVRDSGAPIDLPASALRNIMRVLDGPTLAYLPTLLSILLTRRNQRPGDLAAGTLVIRESARPGAREGATAGAPPGSRVLDASAVTAQELSAVRRFLERRADLDPLARRELAHRLEQGLRPKVSGAGSTRDPERFLEELADAKARGRSAPSWPPAPSAPPPDQAI
jgi:uncharacterized RDD family membrane protein YckC